jgi:hypothetical protein
MSLWRRWNNALLGLVQVRLTETGCSQLESTWAAMEVAETPWGAVRDVLIKPRRSGRARLRFDLRTPWWHFGKTFPVDADVECSPEQAEALRGRVEAWRRAAAEGAAVPAAV